MIQKTVRRFLEEPVVREASKGMQGAHHAFPRRDELSTMRRMARASPKMGVTYAASVCLPSVVRGFNDRGGTSIRTVKVEC
jgi:hypothetical protein